MRRRYAPTSSSKKRIFIRHDLSALVMGEPMIPPAIEFWVCAGYAPDEFLVWIKTATLDDTGWVHKHNHFRKPWALIINKTDSRFDCRDDWDMRRVCAGLISGGASYHSFE